MSAKPLSLTPTYGAQSGQVAMSLLDGTKQQVMDAINDVAASANYFLDTGGVNALGITTSPLSLTLVAGVQFDVLVANTNTGPCTMNVNATGAVAVTDASGAALGASTLIANTIYNFIYDGVAFRAAGTAAAGGVGPGNFTTLAVSSTISGAGVNSLFAAPPPIGSGTPAPGTFSSLGVTGASSFIGTVTARNVAITPVTGTGLLVRSASGAHSTQISDTANNAYNAGYLSLPPVSVSVADISHRGKLLIDSAGGTFTVPAGVFAAGDAFCVYNNSVGNLLISTTIPTVRLAGTLTSGSPRTIAPFGLASVLFITATYISVAGSGVS